MRWGDRQRRDDGMVTVELVAVLPVLLLVTGVLLSAILLVGQRIRVQDAAAEAARLYARGDTAHAREAVASLASGATVEVSRSGPDVRVRVSCPVPAFARWLPGASVTGTAVSVLEPTGQGP